MRGRDAMPLVYKRGEGAYKFDETGPITSVGKVTCALMPGLTACDVQHVGRLCVVCVPSRACWLSSQKSRSVRICFLPSFRCCCCMDLAGDIIPRCLYVYSIQQQQSTLNAWQLHRSTRRLSILKTKAVDGSPQNDVIIDVFLSRASLLVSL